MAYLMTFGKYKGQPITEVPEKDLKYYADWDKIRPDQKSELDKELARRRGGDGPATGHGKPAAPSASGGGGAGAPTSSPISSRARDIIAMGAEALKPCADTNEAMGWLLQLIDGSAAPDSEVPF